MTDIPLNCDGHLACLSCGLSVFLSDIMSEALRIDKGSRAVRCVIAPSGGTIPSTVTF